MRTVRVFYRKTGRLKFISHLDVMRFMSRLVTKSKIPLWYTEGFNQRVYLNFALPLSLGFESDFEIMEFKVLDDGFSNTDCLNALKAAAPEGLDFFSAAEPIMNTKDISFAEFCLNIPKEQCEILKNFLSRESILCEKKTKKGVKQIDLIPKIKSFRFDGNILTIILVAGNEDNLNPSLIMDTFFTQCGVEPFYYSVKRTKILNSELKLFV